MLEDLLSLRRQRCYSLHESAERKLFSVKEQFKLPREKATEHFYSEALEIKLSFVFAISISLRRRLHLDIFLGEEGVKNPSLLHLPV